MNPPMLSMMRRKFLKVGLELMNTPYIWGGKDTTGVDCSGVVTFALFHTTGGRVDWRFSHNTDLLWLKLPPIVDPQPGDLAFYGGKDGDDVDHVMVCLGHGMVFGACGGRPDMKTAAQAAKWDARVKVKLSHLYWESQFRGFRSLAPFLDRVERPFNRLPTS